LPLSSFGAFHAKQLINHGHVKVDGKKVKSGGFELGSSQNAFFANQLEYRARDLIGPGENLRGNHESTMLLRRFKDKSHLALLGRMATSTGRGAVEDYVRALKVKRFTEIFYMTYRNLH